MKRCFFYTAVAVCGILFSCNKAEKNNIVGTWNVKETAGDENGNKTLDASERKVIGDPIISYQYTFKSDGTVSVDLIDKVCGTLTEGKWHLKNDGKELEIVISNTTSRYDIQSLTNKELKTQSDHQTGYRSWMTMENNNEKAPHRGAFLYFFSISREITSFCISEVPSPIVQSLLSR